MGAMASAYREDSFEIKKSLPNLGKYCQNRTREIPKKRFGNSTIWHHIR